MRLIKLIINTAKYWASRDILRLPQELSDVYRAIILNNSLDVKVTRLENQNDTITNPSIIKFNGQWIVASRAVNYKLSGIRRKYKAPGGFDNINSKTYIYKYVSDYKNNDDYTLLLDDRARMNISSAKNGFEDPRLIVWRDQLWGIWTASYIADRGKIIRNTMVLGLIDNGELSQPIILSSPYGAEQEKNWMPFVDSEELYLLYSLQHMEVYHFNRQKLTLIHRKPDPIPSLADCSGSSQLIPWGDDWICVAHFAARRGVNAFCLYPVHYLHKFVVISRDFTLKAISRKFFFCHRGVEFCSGLAVDGDRVLLSFGIEDSSANIMEMTRSQVLTLF